MVDEAVQNEIDMLFLWTYFNSQGNGWQQA